MSRNTMQWLCIVVVMIIVSFFVGRASLSDNFLRSLGGASGRVDVRDQINQQFGWGKAPADISISAVDVVRQANTDACMYPIPDIKLAIMNNSTELLQSFGVIFTFVNLLNNQTIVRYGVPSGLIASGSTSRLLSVRPDVADWDRVVDGGGITFPIRVVVGVDTKSGYIVIYSSDFSPEELQRMTSI